MDCQIYLRRLRLREPIYRGLKFGPDINGGSRTSVCERCLYALIGTLKRPGLKDGFRSKEPCEVCGRPVYDLKGVEGNARDLFTGCRGVINSQRMKTQTGIAAAM